MILLKAAIQAKGVTVTQLAKTANVSRSTIRRRIFSGSYLLSRARHLCTEAQATPILQVCLLHDQPNRRGLVLPMA